MSEHAAQSSHCAPSSRACVSSASSNVLLAGLGSPFGTDRIGWLAIDLLEQRCPSVRKIALRSPSELLDQLADLNHLVVIDACRGAGEIGAIVRFEWPTHALSQVAFAGTHDLSLNAVLEIAERLGLLPTTVTIWGIEIGECDADASDLGDVLEQQLASLIEQVIATLPSRSLTP